MNALHNMTNFMILNNLYPFASQSKVNVIHVSE